MYVVFVDKQRKEKSRSMFNSISTFIIVESDGFFFCFQSIELVFVDARVFLLIEK